MTAQVVTRGTQEQPQRLSDPAGQHLSMHARNKLNSACPVTPEGTALKFPELCPISGDSTL